MVASQSPRKLSLNVDWGKHLKQIQTAARKSSTIVIQDNHVLAFFMVSPLLSVENQPCAYRETQV
jgi:hypothetical protein